MLKVHGNQPPDDPGVYRVSMDLSLRALLADQRRMDQIIDLMLIDMARAIADKLEDELNKPGSQFESFLRNAVADEIRKQVKVEVAKRVDQFIEDMI